ncbi:MAG: hypothetical protein MnENMB40S_09220 [Rhizobiaceae bacterium MnEN-MB40S]|nr:MAG: hypothetical protein MnENMB40S_09220 [Rhizobiaceae bacterium MnEN-MB40S]
MPENLALKLSTVSVSYIVALNILFMIIGGLLAPVFARSLGELDRAPYFACSFLLFLALSVTMQFWLAAPIAMSGGFFWLLYLVQFISFIIYGFLVAVLAMARSRDIFGHGYGAILAFIPFVGFYLMFARGQDLFSERKIMAPRFFSGAMGVVIGVVSAVVGFVLVNSLPERVQRITENRFSAPDMQEKGFDISLRTYGLTRTLGLVAKGVDVPVKFDDGRILIRIETEGDTLLYIYSVVSDDGASVERWRRGLTQGNCNNAQLRRLFEAGATIEHVFLSRSDGYEDGRVVIDRETCGL